MNNAFIWLFQRITAVLLILVLLVHFWILHYKDPGLIILYGNVAVRLKTAFYLITDSVLLVAGLFHGMTGLSNILLDYGVSPSVRTNSTIILTVVGLALLILGMYSLVHFIL